MRKELWLAPLVVVAVACGKKSEETGNATASVSAASTSSPQPVASATPSAKPLAAASTARPPASAGDTASAQPVAAAHGPAIDVTLTCVESARASSEQKDHPASAAFDADPRSAWNDSAPDGKGQWVEARLRAGTWVDHVEVGGGWSVTTADGTDLWKLNSSYKTMHVTWDGGETDVQFDRAADRGVKKKVPIGAVTSFVRLTATAVDRGRSADLCLDEALVIGSCSSACDATAAACTDTLFVQLAVPQQSTPATYDYPTTRSMLKGRPDLVGVRVVEATHKGQRVMGAVVANRCQADAMLQLARTWGVTGPTASCEKLELRREVWTIDAAMGTEPRGTVPTRPSLTSLPAKFDDKSSVYVCPSGFVQFMGGPCSKECTSDAQCGTGEKCSNVSGNYTGRLCMPP